MLLIRSLRGTSILRSLRGCLECRMHLDPAFDVIEHDTHGFSSVFVVLPRITDIKIVPFAPFVIQKEFILICVVHHVGINRHGFQVGMLGCH